MDKALVFGTKDCRFESCQGQKLSHRGASTSQDMFAEPCCRLERCQTTTGRLTNKLLGPIHRARFASSLRVVTRAVRCDQVAVTKF